MRGGKKETEVMKPMKRELATKRTERVGAVPRKAKEEGAGEAGKRM